MSSRLADQHLSRIECKELGDRRKAGESQCTDVVTNITRLTGQGHKIVAKLTNCVDKPQQKNITS